MGGRELHPKAKVLTDESLLPRKPKKDESNEKLKELKHGSTETKPTTPDKKTAAPEKAKDKKEPAKRKKEKGREKERKFISQRILLFYKV